MNKQSKKIASQDLTTEQLAHVTGGNYAMPAEISLPANFGSKFDGIELTDIALPDFDILADHATCW